MVIFPYRADIKDNLGEGVLILGKHRNGSEGDAKVTFQTQWAGFEDYIGEPF